MIVCNYLSRLRILSLVGIANLVSLFGLPLSALIMVVHQDPETVEDFVSFAGSLTCDGQRMDHKAGLSRVL